MLFSTPFFVFVFLPVFFVLYWFLPFRPWVLLLGSLVFYAWSEPVFVGVVIASAILDWILGRVIFPENRWRKFWVSAGVASNLALLVYAKYTVFAIENINALLTAGGWRTLTVPQIMLPLGVSFIVFEKITYLVDVYRRVAPPSPSLLHYLNYVFLFPKLLAGPIVKYHDIAAQLAKPSHCYEDVREGLIRFLVGLAKKVLLADMLAPVADEVFALPPSALDSSTAWLGLLCFTLQIYFDFSGYSDMAIGMGRILGFRLLENFRDPYLATSFTDFWRRWHISLSTWIKEYLYIPLGGSRGSKARSYVNLCICFLLSGLWHGASWNFVTWGCIHGFVLVADRAFWLEWQKHLPRFLNVMITFSLVALSWVFFRCETFAHSMSFFAALVGARSTESNTVFLHNDGLVSMVAGFICILLPLTARSAVAGSSSPKPRIAALAAVFLLMLLCAGRMSVSSFHPFL